MRTTITSPILMNNLTDKDYQKYIGQVEPDPDSTGPENPEKPDDDDGQKPA